jgi:CRP/FNR family cyclic AMP-dependent transcriptional regulator
VTIDPEDLRAIPLFRDISVEHLTTLTNAFDRRTLPAGEVLFKPGDLPTHFLLLVRGEITLKEAGNDRFRLQAVAPVGELGAVTGLPRNTEAVTATEADVWSIAVPVLVKLFESNSEVGYRFYRNLVATVSAKVASDRRRLDEVRANLIRTQKRMKELRELVLAAKETEISQPVFDALDELIERNRRAHYRVIPAPQLPASVRNEDGTIVRLRELSDGYLKLELPAAAWPKGTEWAAVLVLPGREIMVSGNVLRAGADGVVMKLDLLIDEYKTALQDYVTRLQMLDYVV